MSAASTRDFRALSNWGRLFSRIVVRWVRRRDVRMPDSEPFRLPFGPTVHVLTVLVISFLLTSITWREWALVLGVLLLASVRFAFGRPRRVLAAESAA